jgi:cytochrome c oxidase assembly protein subunit 15
MIFAMVVIGGITRLTLSGLSITEWQPVTGILPPLSAASWVAEFEKYQHIPQYRLVKAGMSLAEFQTIYWWEYVHRLWGRLIGVAYAVPFLYFWLRGQLPRRLAWPLAGIFALGAAQGVLGWYMVESGLADRVEVSQYRLVAHLALALAIYAVTLWITLDVLQKPSTALRPLGARVRAPVGWRIKDAPGVAHAERREPGEGVSEGLTVRPLTPTLSPDGGEGVNRVWRRAADAIIALVALTIVAGGFVAGLHAGLVYNTFPLMDGGFLPPEYAQLQPFVRNWFENAAAAQFDHRVLATTTAAAILALWLAGSRAALPGRARLALHALLAIAALQFALGVSTLLLVVPIPLAAAHQGGAVLLLTAAIVLRHTLRRRQLDAAAGAAI